jgi:putative hemolysin
VYEGLDELLVRQVMVPRTEIEAIEADTTFSEILNLISSSPYTKFPVYEDEIDQVLGILHVKDLLKTIQRPDCQSCTARSLMRETIYVPETLPADAMLQRLRSHRQHIAIVLDEYGGTAGLVTLEDLLEEIVGEVDDQFDVSTPEIQILEDGTYLVDGLTSIEEVNEQLNLKLEDPNYDTIAGYTLGRLGRIPHINDVIEGDGLRMEVESMDGFRIARLKLTVTKCTADPE